MNPIVPSVYQAVRAVGVLRPEFDPNSGDVFTKKLEVFGTAFWLKEERVLVTCAHVVENLLNAPLVLAGLLVVGKAGQYRRAMVTTIDHVHDLAILKLVDGNGKPVPAEDIDTEALTGLILAETSPVVGSRVGYAGFPMGNQLLNQLHDPTYAEGVIGIQERIDNERKNIQVSGHVINGFSGGPVVLAEKPNQVIGIVSNGPTINGVSPGFFMAVSFKHIKKLAELSNS